MNFRIIPRGEWGAQHENGSGAAPLPAREVWLHHSVTIAPDLVPPFTDDAAAIRTLERIGEDRFGRGISYTWLITPAGLIFEGHGVDRVGSHTGGRNSIARAICFVGNYEENHPTENQIASAAWLLRHARDRGWIMVARLNGGHRDLKQTACPGQHAYADIPAINQLATRGPVVAPIQEEDVTPEQDRMLWNADRINTAILSGKTEATRIRALQPDGKVVEKTMEIPYLKTLETVLARLDGLTGGAGMRMRIEPNEVTVTLEQTL
jgi:hypothetical protein